MFTEKQYISANKNACVNSCICFYLWKSKSFADNMEEIADHIKRYGYCNPESMTAAVKNALQTMVTEAGVKAFIREYKKTYAPLYKTVNAFIAGEYETPGLTAREIADIIQQQLTTM